MTSVKTTIGGALSALGKTLLGIGVVPQLGGVHSDTLTYVAVAGFILDAIGGFFAHLFAADAAALRNIQDQMKLVPGAISTTDTTILAKSIADSNPAIK